MWYIFRFGKNIGPIYIFRFGAQKMIGPTLSIGQYFDTLELIILCQSLFSPLQHESPAVVL